MTDKMSTFVPEGLSRLARAKYWIQHTLDMLTLSGCFQEVSCEFNQYGGIKVWSIHVEYHDKHTVEPIAICSVCDKSVYKAQRYIERTDGDVIHEACQ